MDSSDQENVNKQGTKQENNNEFHPMKLKTLINVNILEEEISDLKFHLNRVVFKPIKKLVLQSEGRKNLSSKYRAMSPTQYNIETLKQCLKNVDVHFSLIKKDVDIVYKENRRLRSLYERGREKQVRKEKLSFEKSKNNSKLVSEANTREKKLLSQLCDDLETERKNLLHEAGKYHSEVGENLNLRRKYERQIEQLKNQNNRLVEHNSEILQQLRICVSSTSSSTKKTRVSDHNRSRRTREVINHRKSESSEDRSSTRGVNSSRESLESVDLETLERQDYFIRLIKEKNSIVEKILREGDEDDEYLFDDEDSDVEVKKAHIDNNEDKSFPEYDTSTDGEIQDSDFSLASESTNENFDEESDDIEMTDTDEEKKSAIIMKKERMKKQDDEKEELHTVRMNLLRQARDKLNDIQEELLENERKFSQITNSNNNSREVDGEKKESDDEINVV